MNIIPNTEILLISFKLLFMITDLFLSFIFHLKFHAFYYKRISFREGGIVPILGIFTFNFFFFTQSIILLSS